MYVYSESTSKCWPLLSASSKTFSHSFSLGLYEENFITDNTSTIMQSSSSLPFKTNIIQITKEDIDNEAIK